MITGIFDVFVDQGLEGEGGGTDLGRYRPYPEYKDSGVEWLGEIPEHWDVNKLGRVTTCLDGKRIPLNTEQRGSMQGDYPYWGANSIVDHLNQWLFDENLVLPLLRRISEN